MKLINEPINHVINQSNQLTALVALQGLGKIRVRTMRLVSRESYTINTDKN